jgi:CTP synthase (UTP-ammonia lyase)
MRVIRIGLIGDYRASVLAHTAIPAALKLIGMRLDWEIKAEWLPTRRLETAKMAVSDFNAIWCVPGSPYESEQGAIEGIRYAREADLPFLGTCGGFQHAILEYARNVLKLTNAEHAEANPSALRPLIAPLSCALVEVNGSINLMRDSFLYKIYGKETIEEGYHCRYGLNPQLEYLLEESDLKAVGRDTQGEVRAMELKGKRFYILTQFQPERVALKGLIPAIVEAFISAAAR